MWWRTDDDDDDDVDDDDDDDDDDQGDGHPGDFEETGKRSRAENSSWGTYWSSSPSFSSSPL